MDMRKMGRRSGRTYRATENGRTIAEAAGDPEAVTWEQLQRQRLEGQLPVDINKLIQSQLMGTGQMMPRGAPPMQGDPMQEAIAAWTEVNGREPATDAEFAEIESTLQEAMMGDPREQIVDQMTSGEVEADTSKYRPSPPEEGNTVYDEVPTTSVEPPEWVPYKADELAPAIDIFTQESGKPPQTEEDWNNIIDMYENGGDD